MSKKKSIALVGLPGCGKSVIGKELSKKFNMNFIDIDSEIEKSSFMKIKEIFNLYGEEEFRRLELKIIQKYKDEENVVMSTGGGAWIQDGVREALKGHYDVVYIKSDFDTIYSRVKAKNTRPMLNGINQKEKLKELYKVRHKFYETADYEFVNNSEISEVIEEMINLFGEKK